MYLYKTQKTTVLSKQLQQCLSVLVFTGLLTACGNGGTPPVEGGVVVVTPPVTPPAASPGRVQFASTALVINEADGSIDITVTRSAGSEGDIAVDYTIYNDTASTDDYSTQTMTGTLSWTDSDTRSKTISFNIIDDLLVEDNERFSISLSNAINNATLGDNERAEINIIDNDSLATTPDNLYFYVSENNGVNSVYAYDSENLSTAVSSILVDDNTQGETILSSFDMSSTTAGLISNLKFPGIMYVKGGIIWKVLAQSTTSINNPIQVSSDNNIQLCGNEAFVNEVPDNINDSVYFYLEAGADSTCYTVDDQWKYVKFGWNNTVNPVLTMDFIGDIEDASNTSEPVFLAWNEADSSLYKCSILCSFILNLETRPSIFGALSDDNKEYLLIGNSIVILDVAAQTISDPVFTSRQLFFSPFEMSDASFSYFSEAGKIYRLDSKGSAALELIDEGVTKMIVFNPFAASNERLIYSVIDIFNNTSEIRTLLKTGGVSVQLLSSSDNSLFIMGSSGNRIYYNYLQAGTPVAGMIFINGTGKVESRNQRWAGSTRPTTFSLFSGIPAFNMYKVDMGTQMLSVYDAATFTLKKDIGMLPADVSDMMLLGVGDIARGYATEQALSGPTFNFDLFYSDASSATPLVRITRSLNVDDAVIMY